MVLTRPFVPTSFSWLLSGLYSIQMLGMNSNDPQRDINNLRLYLIGRDDWIKIPSGYNVSAVS